MRQHPIVNFRDLPILESNRRRTDFCCILVAVAFVIFMLISAIVKFNKSNLLKINYPTDADGRTCGYDLPQYPYSYLAAPFSSNIDKRLCVSKCPTANDTTIKCKQTQSMKCNDSLIMIYDSSAQVNRLGGFCVASDPNVYNKAVESYRLQEKINFIKALDIVKLALIIALVLGILYFLAVQFFPRTMAWLILILAAISCLVMAIVLFVDQSPSLSHYQGWIKFLGVLLLVILVGLVLNLVWMRFNIKAAGIFLQYASRFVSSNKFVIWWIVLFEVLTLGFLALMVFQFLAFSSGTSPILNQDSIYWTGPTITPFYVLLTFQFAWGAMFLRDLFCFIIQGHATRWYSTVSRVEACSPWTRFFKYHFGSVIAGSFLNTLFWIPDIFMSLFRFDRVPLCSQVFNCFYRSCFCCCNIFELARQNAYAYIHLTSVPYCNSARQCEFIANRSKFLNAIHPMLKVFRISSHIFIVFVTISIAYFMSRARLMNHDVSLGALFYVVVGCFLILPYLLCLHADAADALAVSYLAEEHMGEYDPNYKHEKAPRGLKYDLENIAVNMPYYQ